MAATILLCNRKNWRNERFPADFTIWSLGTNAPEVGTNTQVFRKNHEKLEKRLKKILKIVKNCEKFGKITKNDPV